jgi:hypothetical protein
MKQETEPAGLTTLQQLKVGTTEQNTIWPEESINMRSELQKGNLGENSVLTLTLFLLWPNLTKQYITNKTKMPLVY